VGGPKSTSFQKFHKYQWFFLSQELLDVDWGWEGTQCKSNLILNPSHNSSKKIIKFFTQSLKSVDFRLFSDLVADCYSDNNHFKRNHPRMR
jgi:hypothetical protein